MELTAEQIHPHLGSFHTIWDNTIDKEINPIPDDKRVTVYCSNGTPSHTGYIVDVMSIDLGIDALIAKSWILHSDLELLVNNGS